MQDKPNKISTTQSDGKPLKPLPQAILERRATNHFTSDPVPDDILNSILLLGAQAPSGYNLQPWRFIVVREEENRKRLQKAAFNQPKVAEAPVVIIAIGMKDEWKELAAEVFEEGAKRGAGDVAMWEKAKDGALKFLTGMQKMDVWVNRHIMIAVTTMMLVAESYGFDTAPMEGFDPAAVKAEFGIPEEGEIVCLLAIGRGAEPEKAYPGRFELDRIVSSEHFGEPWKA
jgi:nitroreductase